MKISSASKKVLASALSAAMVVAFAPTVAFGAGAYVEGSTPLDGAVASCQATSGGKLVTWSYTESLSGSAVNALNEALADAKGVIVLHQDIVGNVVVPANTAVTLDLNGHTITNDSDAAKGAPVVKIASGGQLTVKGGTLTASTAENANHAAVGNTDVNSAGKLVVKSGTFNGTVDTDVVSIEDGTFNGAVTDREGGLSVKNATIEVSSDKDNVTALMVKSTGAVSGRGNLTVSGALTVKAEASKNDKAATAVDANVATSGDKAVVNISAATTGSRAVPVASSGYCDATAIAGNLAVSGKSTADVTATAKDDAAAAYGVAGMFAGKANVTATVAGEYAGNGVNAYVLSSGVISSEKITGGKFVGKLRGLNSSTKVIEAGTFTDDPTNYVGTNYTVIDDGTYYTVYAKTAGTSAKVDATALGKWFDNTGSAAQNTIAEAFNQVIDLVANDKAASNLVYAEGKTAADLKALIASGKASYVVTVTQYKEKVATDAEKANFAAIQAFVKGKKSAVVDPTNKVFSYSIAITDNDTNEAKRVTYGYLTDLGTNARGEARTLTLNTANFSAPDKAAVASKGAGIAIANNGVAADQELTADRTGVLDHKVSATGMFAAYELSLVEIEEGETPAPAPEKATQGIDVSKKSRTVKIGSKTKTAKALYFKMGASAETELATAKKSGSSRITVSGDKVTLKKGTKKGTYTAKVSLKAAGSDEYLAAAKTITVKFVVKK